METNDKWVAPTTAEKLIRNNAITALQEFLATPDDAVTMKMATIALKMVTALLLAREEDEQREKTQQREQNGKSINR